MSYRKYLKEIEIRIASNREKGAAELYQDALNILGKWFSQEKKEKEPFIKILSALFKAQPSMAPMLNLVNQLLLAVENSWDEVEKIINLLRKKHETSLKRIVELSKEYFSPFNCIATVSYSSTVIEVLKSLSSSRKLKFIISEGIPGEHGVRTAKTLKNYAEIILCSDAFAPTYVKEADVFITGADAVKKESVINGCGTYPMALACKEAGIPYFVLSDTQKLLHDKLAVYHTIDRITYEKEQMLVLHALFDETPLRYATGMITEEGIFTPNKIKEKIENIKISSLIKEIAEG